MLQRQQAASHFDQTQPMPRSVSAGSIQGVDDHAKNRNAARSMLAAWGLTSDVTVSMVDAWADADFSAGRTSFPRTVQPLLCRSLR